MSDLKSRGFAGVGTLENNRNIKALQNIGNKVTMGLGDPRQSEGDIGDITVRQISGVGLRCYIKTNSGWYDINTLTGAVRTEWTLMRLSNSWAHYSATYNEPSYFKDENGFVHLRGGIGSGSSASAVITTLPRGFRPSGTTIIAAARATARSSVKITLNGEVNFSNGGNTTLSFLDGVSFYARQIITSSGGGSKGDSTGGGASHGGGAG